MSGFLGVGGEGEMSRGHEGTLGGMGTFTTWSAGMVSQVYTFVRICQFVGVRYLQFLYVNYTAIKGSKTKPMWEE